jgi:hypothetical protein
MKRVITILIFLCTLTAFGQPADLRAAAEKFDKALVEKGSASLKILIHPGLNYGHSNGWVQSNKELVDDLFNGKITYTKVESRDFVWSGTSPTLATVRSTANIEYVLDGKPGKLKLHVLQVWRKGRSGWQLLARQSTKLEEKP